MNDGSAEYRQDVADLRQNIGNALFNAGKFADAVSICLKALPMREGESETEREERGKREDDDENKGVKGQDKDDDAVKTRLLLLTNLCEIIALSSVETGDLFGAVIFFNRTISLKEGDAALRGWVRSDAGGGVMWEEEELEEEEADDEDADDDEDDEDDEMNDGGGGRRVKGKTDSIKFLGRSNSKNGSGGSGGSGSKTNGGLFKSKNSMRLSQHLLQSFHHSDSAKEVARSRLTREEHGSVCEVGGCVVVFRLLRVICHDFHNKYLIFF